jgi:hypothetical protein
VPKVEMETKRPFYNIILKMYIRTLKERDIPEL